MSTTPMTPENLAKYNAANPPQKPKHGRFSPDGQFFLCETADEIAKLEALGWNNNPFDHSPPYKPEKAVWREKWDQIVFDQPKPAEPSRDLAAELAAAQARIAELESKGEPKAVGRPRKVAA